ncbi:glycosyltransferase family 2 protein [Candidatus Woesearchaeota archaeon]|nr:glycosyltransferase family 2 protein [Candidatus Woesearchaeota archaeon]
MIITFLDSILLVTYFLLLFLTIFWLLILFNPDKKEKPTPAHDSPLPQFSVIVPAYNEEKSIEQTLTSLVRLRYPTQLIQIIVVNDGSKDKTPEIVKTFIQNHPNYNITLLNQTNAGKGRALNNGIKHITGEFFACLDADSFVEENALQVMLPLFEEQEVAAVCPTLKVRKPNTILEKVQWSEYIINMFYKFLNAKIDCIHVTPGPFSIYRSAVVRKLGGFSEETITEDLEMAIRLQKHNYKILQTFDTTVETVVPATWKTLFRQRVRWYKGGVDNTIAYKELIFNKKYGDFGMMRMPTIISSGIIVLILTTALIQSLIKRGYQFYLSLSAVNFDVLTLIKHYTFEFNPLILPFFKLTIAATVIILSFLIMILSFKLLREKITNYGKTWTSLFTYFFVYGLFLTTVWVYIAYMFIKKKKNFWH